MNIALVVNETAGGGKGKKFGAELGRELSKSGLHFTEIREKSAEVTLQTFERIHSKDPFTSIVSVGGDGLFHLLLPYAVENSIPILVVPAGTGNDFARSTGTFGMKSKEIVRKLQQANPIKVDIGQIRQRDQIALFGQVMSTGFDSLVNERANTYRRIRGKIKYVVAVARELPLFVPKTYQLTIDGETFETGAMLVAIANGRCYGGGMNVCPDANMQDGLFDVLILKPLPLIEFIRVFPKVFSGKHVSHPAVEIRRCKEISLSSDAIAYADGERIGQLPIEVKILPGALSTWLI